MVQNRWDETILNSEKSHLELRVYTSRLLGIDPTLVLHGGGNTSVKGIVKNVFGNDEKVIFIKGSGFDMAQINVDGFPALRLEPLLEMRNLKEMSDPVMVRELRSQMLDFAAPSPSVETLLHTFLPHKFVDHTHSDAILTLTNQPNGDHLVKSIFGRRVGVVPYVMPGFLLAKLCAKIFEEDTNVEGLILLKHGIFTFGESAHQSYLRMISIVQEAEDFIGDKKRTWHINSPAAIRSAPDRPKLRLWQQIVRKYLFQSGMKAIVTADQSEVALKYCSHPNIKNLCQVGPVTPDHVIRTKRFPLFINREICENVDENKFKISLDVFKHDYKSYFMECSEKISTKKQMLDPLPRCIVLEGLGIIHVGDTLKNAHIVRDIYQHTMHVILEGSIFGSYEALGTEDIFDMEYWVLEQDKLKLGAKSQVLTGKVAIISGGASGIGKAIATTFSDYGAIVMVIDNDENKLATLKSEWQTKIKIGEILLAKADIRNPKQIDEAVARLIEATGGIDIVVANAGIFPKSSLLENIEQSDWQNSLDVNLSGTWNILSATLPWLKKQENGGDVIVVGSKNVPAPGPKVGAYSVSKAAQTQLARIAALEGAPFGIRVNMLHPHLIFDTSIWSTEIINDRALSYGMTSEQYKKNNLLKTELSSKDVASAALALVSGSFSKTTGAQIMVDGGHERTL